METIKRFVSGEWDKWCRYFDLYNHESVRLPTSLLVTIVLLVAFLSYLYPATR